MDQTPLTPTGPAPRREPEPEARACAPPGQAAEAASSGKPAGRGPGPEAVNYESLQALLERFRAMEARNRDLKKQFEALPDETHLRNLRSKLTRVKRWLDDQKNALAARLREQEARESAAAAPGEEGRPEPEGPAEAAVPGAAGAEGRFSFAAWVLIAVLSLSGVFAGFALLGGPSGFRAAVARLVPGRAGSPPGAGPAAPVVIEKLGAPGRRASPAPHQVGLANYGGRWLSVDWAEGKIFELDPASGLKFLRGFPNSFTTGLSAGDKALWSTDAFNRRCYRHDPESFAVRASFTTPGPSPSAVHWDGGSLWLADSRTRRAYKYLNMKSGAITLVQYQLLETEPVGLWRTDDLLWVLDRAGKTVRRYRLQENGKLAQADLLRLSGLPTGKTRPIGMALSGGELWILTEAPCLLYRYDLDRIDWKENGGAEPGGRGA